MNISIDEARLDTILEVLSEKHIKLMKDAESWGYDLEGDFDRYMDIRQKELLLANTIHDLKKQRTALRENSSIGSEVPLEEWEKKLVRGESPDQPPFSSFRDYLATVDVNDPAAMSIAVLSNHLTVAQAKEWIDGTLNRRRELLNIWMKN